MRSILALTGSLLLGGCALLSPSQATATFTQDGYDVTCHWDQPVIGEPEPGLDAEARSFCAARARDAVGTLLPQMPGVTVESVTVATDGSTYVCYVTGSVGEETCEAVLPPLQEG